MIDRLTKRLLMSMQNGVSIAYADGHRWLIFYEVLDRSSLLDTLTTLNIDYGIKIYGDIHEALDYIDSLLNKCGMETLERQFDEYNDFFYEK